MVNELCLNETLVEAVKEVFETMIFMDVEKTDGNEKVEGDAIMGVITFQNGLKGCLTIYCNMSCARSVASNMLGLEPGEDIEADDIKDAIGEVTNMVMGSVKSRIQEGGDSLQVSIPTIVRGQAIENHLAEKENIVQVKVGIEDQYVVEVTFLYTQSND